MCPLQKSLPPLAQTPIYSTADIHNLSVALSKAICTKKIPCLLLGLLTVKYVEWIEYCQKAEKSLTTNTHVGGEAVIVKVIYCVNDNIYFESDSWFISHG